MLGFLKGLGDGDLPRFFIRAMLTPFFYGKIHFNKKAKARIRVFENFEDSSKNPSMINAILISYGFVSK